MNYMKAKINAASLESYKWKPFAIQSLRKLYLEAKTFSNYSTFIPNPDFCTLFMVTNCLFYENLPFKSDGVMFIVGT